MNWVCCGRLYPSLHDNVEGIFTSTNSTYTIVDLRHNNEAALRRTPTPRLPVAFRLRAMTLSSTLAKLQPAVPDLTLHLDIPAAQMLRYYRKEAHVVQARATSGQLVQFPAAALQRHVAPDGIHGTFRIEFDANYKFVSLERVSEFATAWPRRK